MNTSKVIACLVLFQCFLFLTGFGAVTRLPDAARTALLHESDFTIVKQVDKIPPGALQAIRKAKKPDDFKIADSEKAFQKTDVIMDESLPWRQLQFAAISKEYLLFHHARGGRGLGYYFVLLKKSDDKFTILWTAAGPQCSDFNHFLKELKSNKIDDSFNNSSY